METSTVAGHAWMRLAACYFAAAVLLGVYMGASADIRWYPVHAHIALLGWVSMGLFSWADSTWPSLSEGRLAKVQFWLYNVSLPVMMLSLAGKIAGVNAVEPVLGISSVTTALAVLLFVYGVLTRLGR